MSYAWTAPTIPYLISEESHIKTTKYEAQWLETILMIGSFCGLPLTIYLVDKIGRKNSLLLASFVQAVSWIATALAATMTGLLVARFFSGMASDMAFVAAPMYIAEMADQKIRGFLSGIIYLMMLTGCVIVYCVGPYLPFYVSPVIGALLSTTELITFSFMPETPYYLLYKHREDEALKALQYFRSDVDAETELKEISKAMERQRNERGRIQDLFLVKSNRKAVITMTVLNGGQHFCAISVIVMNLHLILKAAGSIYIDYAIAAIVFSVIMLVAAVGATLTVDMYGRKILLVFSAVLSGICLFAIALYFNLQINGVDVMSVSWIPTVSVMIYAAAFKLGLGIVPIMITSEIFPAKVKAMGMTISDAMYVGWSAIVLQLYQWLESSYGLHAPFYLFSVCCFLVMLYTIFYIPETKGKSLEEIQMLLKEEEPLLQMPY
ncbi:hypothetical protein NQ315_011091 [Exocentrus adspersus]|uniref:Major facilitator superfamily (MFS) profile domain-containing protein n=1 Tax=Exocentrus adspersus TaxID=1586481 RepID=A0AAV8VXM0_9CUCU|nr:hypothetical protein NQ315_011091 [Exocentrus adspersus]